MERLQILVILIFAMFSTSLQAKELSGEYSAEKKSGKERAENLERTLNLVTKIETYMQERNAFVGIVSRRGAGDPATGISDTDNLDLTGMAHAGFIVKNGFSKDAEYITFNLVRKKGEKKVGSKKYDLSVLKIWGLPQFFAGAFEKDAIVFLPEKKVQLKLWNMLRANGVLDIEEQKRYIKDGNGKQRYDEKGNPLFRIDRIVKNGIFPILHNPEYNLLSDYSETSTQNCNEHLLKTYVGARDFWNSDAQGYDMNVMSNVQLREFRQDVVRSIEEKYRPGEMVLSRTKSTFAFVQNIRFGERHKKAPSLFGLKLKKERFDVVSVDSFCDLKNQEYLGWSDFRVFRENHDAKQGWFIEDWRKNYVKVNRFTGKKNAIN